MRPSRLDADRQASMPPPQPPQEAVDMVTYLNDAWTPYHSVLASCRQLVAAGFEVSERLYK